MTSEQSILKYNIKSIKAEVRRLKRVNYNREYYLKNKERLGRSREQ